VIPEQRDPRSCLGLLAAALRGGRIDGENRPLQ
jgi:hypothetical protein